MKLLVFAHTPPPHHGQSYMVKLMLEGFGGDQRRRKTAGATPSAKAHGIDCYHVNARLSRSIEDIGEAQGGKILWLLFYCLQAIWCRFRHGVTTIYYVPAPGKRVALFRDWLVMALCRPFFKHLILHWHAAGLGKWLETSTSMKVRSLTYRAMRDADLSITLSDFNQHDAEKLTARRIAVVNIGVPDPCPDFAHNLLHRRNRRLAARQALWAGRTLSSAERRLAGESPETIQVVYLAHCTREKGLFDAVEGVALANEKLAAGKSSLRFRLTLIGAFPLSAEELELEELVRRRGLQNVVERLGFVSAERKAEALASADLFCFPTWYNAENQPGNLIEAMAYGLPMVTTRWRSIPEMLPPEYPGLVDPKSPEQVAEALLRLVTADLAEVLRETFVRRFTLERHLAAMAEAIRSVETPIQPTIARPVPGLPQGLPPQAAELT